MGRWAQRHRRGSAAESAPVTPFNVNVIEAASNVPGDGDPTHLFFRFDHPIVSPLHTTFTGDATADTSGGNEPNNGPDLSVASSDQVNTSFVDDVTIGGTAVLIDVPGLDFGPGATLIVPSGGLTIVDGGGP